MNLVATTTPAAGRKLPPAKLCAPSSGATQVWREALCARACHAASARLIVVRAPAGFGKTTTLAQMRERFEAAGTHTAWITLDAADNDLPRFVDGLVAAVSGMTLDDAPWGAPAPLDIVDRLAAYDSPFALFFDEFEAIQDPAVLGLLREIMEHLPRRGQIVVGSRSVPDLGLGRLRAHGQLLELDADDLRFSLDESAQFFAQRLREPLAAESLAQLHRKTEGWIAALWLASIALERHDTGADFIERFSGSNRAVASYLGEAVLAQQSGEVRQFLLRTSILHELDPSLCDALTPRAERGEDGASERMLEKLEAALLFVRPLVGAGMPTRVWRYHSLFADFLRSRLAASQPTECSRLHLAASAWYEEHGRPVRAIDHAIEGGDLPHALALLEQYAETFLEQGRMRLLSRWFGSLPAARLAERPLLEVIAVWSTCFTRGPAEAMSQLQLSQCSNSTDSAVRANLMTLEPLLLAMLDRYGEALEVGRRSLAQLPSGRSFSDIGLLNMMSMVIWASGDTAGAMRLIEAARRSPGSNAFTRTYTESTEGLIDLQEGRLRQAAARFRIAMGGGSDASQQASGNAWAGVFHAAAVYESNKLDDALVLLNVYLPMARMMGLPDHMIVSHVMRSRIAFNRGDAEQANEVIADLEYLGHHRRLPRVIAAAHLERAYLLLLQGQARASKEELVRADLPGLWSGLTNMRLPAQDVDYLEMGRLRWDITFGDCEAALQRVRSEIEHAQRLGSQRRVLKLQVLQALGQYRAGRIAAGIKTLDEALRRASEEGFVRLVIDEGVALTPLIQRLLSNQFEDASRRSDPIYVEYLQRLLDALGPASDGHVAPPAASDDGLLTRQEVRVLELLAMGYSNGAMSAQLAISDSTVRTHLRNINVKLGSHSRMQAVATARRLALIQ